MKCLDGQQCIEEAQMCDGHYRDCNDGSDESDIFCLGLSAISYLLDGKILCKS